jgi:hypothetical protein
MAALNADRSASKPFVPGSSRSSLTLSTLQRIWGVVGTILCLPIMVIIYGHFRPTQPIAILLSSDGEIEWHTYRAEPAP